MNTGLPISVWCLELIYRKNSRCQHLQLIHVFRKDDSSKTAGGEECETPGDLVSWEEAKWTLHSQAKVIELDR